MDGVTLEFQEEAIRAVAKEAIKRGTGARGLRSVLEDRMLEIMYDIPSRVDVSKCVMTKDAVLNGAPPILVTSERKPKKKEETA
jgi:ATP-dependent Clp protease ATP-binding subunit ClpX